MFQLALSAACPVQRGYLTDGDCRWNIIAASVDDRTKEERGLEPLKENRFVIPKSRYDSIDSYLSPTSDAFNDIDLVYDKVVYQQLRDAGIDHLLAQHMAHLFIRDPISLFSERVDQDDTCDTDHFENIQSTNWQTMRFKPPPPGSCIGWRVEFRPTEVQLTDFENAAYVVFVVLLTRAILSFKLNFVMPISKVDVNMKAAQKRDAVLNEKFYFRRNITTCNTPKTCSETICCVSNQDCFPQMTINEIINGKSGEFPGLVPLIYQFLHSVDDLDVDTSCTISQYLHLIQERASGRLMTTARWMRDFITKHPEYKHDSVVTETINYDFVNECHQVLNGKPCPELLIQHKTKTNDSIPLAMKKHEQALIGLSEMSKSCDSSEDNRAKWPDCRTDDKFEDFVEEL
ncbi:hypothetical protein NP493_1155g00000 [Ridgeia piscesae]|uniref:Glutamate--cysteine ligase n=1 Tax=Ridgeia piscesae TaxID=27915 RepID=A0AAD9KFM0_RIDPI|nr:hypothetical protein NP493_1155g00000 [Ridgeia piscesae]